MLSKSATYKMNFDGLERDIMITPLFLKSETESWQPNEIYQLSQTFDLPVIDFEHTVIEPLSLGKIIVDDHMDWHYEGEHQLSEEEVEQIAQFVMSQI